MESFEHIYQRACKRKGGVQQLELRLTPSLTQQEIQNIPNEQWLAAFSMKVFQCGISWKLVRDKWPQFNDVFFDFKIEPLLMLSDEDWEQKAKDKRIIRHNTKVMAIKQNAIMIHNASIEHGSFGHLVAQFAQEDITQLWRYLKSKGSRLGGNTGAYALRALGVDTFILSSDVESFLRGHNIIQGGRDTLKSHKAALNAFQHWQKESGRSMTHISQIIAFGHGDNRV